MAKFTVIGGNASQDLAKRLARKLKATYINTELRAFPDGENKITLSAKPKKNRIIVVQSVYPPVDSNLIQCLSLISKAKQFSSNVIAVVPYMGYARQDREFLPREVVSMQVIAKLFKAAGATKLIVVDIHSLIGLKHFKISAKNISAVPELVKFFKKLKLKNPLVVSPDLGGKKRTKEFAKLLNSNYITLKKKRDRKTGKVKIISTNLKQVIGKDIILVDDMISSGGSIIKATEFLKKQKCKRVFVSCTHALLIDDAEKKIKKAGVTKIVSTNTIPGTTSKVDVSNIIAKTVL
ncbi:MAG: ribose-phosphate pyrophosphokinase [Marine Group I thaumarchaeote]|nr:MAG: ribose-phosphate pyrophosphokinase [Marine Group I thaumarchaeote]